MVNKLFVVLCALILPLGAAGQLHSDVWMEDLPQRKVHWEGTFTIPRLLWFTGTIEYKINFPVEISSFRPPTCYYLNADTGKSEGFELLKADLGSATIRARRGFRIRVECTGYQLKPVPLRGSDLRLLPPPKIN